MRGGVSSYEMSSTCVQSGSIPRPLGGYQPSVMMEPSSPASAWQYHTILPKQEPIDHEERNDSGISGSEFHSSSPGSDHSENIPYPAAAASQAAHSSVFYSTPFRMNQTMQQNPAPLYHNDPVTPPSSEPTSSPKTTCTEVKPEASNHQSIPYATPEQTDPQMPANTDCDDPLKRLQMTLEKNGLLPSALSPKLSEYSGEDEARSDNESEEYDEQGLRIPKVNSHGKVKTFRCKQCDFVAITKLDFWEHTKSHIKADKLLTCPKCPFVTEYKHHLEYHLRNHFGSKPFKCTQCNYSCVNKSMLNSHLKSHSNIYQYRCAECSYATKYCHSLKLHLRKYKHKPAMVLNPDGTPNPIPIIDVYGTRRGPKIKGHDSKPNEDAAPKPEQILPFPLSQFMLNTQMQLPFNGFPFFGGFPGALPNPLLLQNLEKLARERQASSSMQEAMEESSSEGVPTEAGVLDLSKPEGSMHKNRRKGRAFKLETTHGNSSDDDEETTMFANVEVVENKETDHLEENKEEKDHPMSYNNNKDDYNCQYCQINFGDPVLYTMHMGYHGYKHPFTCNMCGEECQDKVSFFLHIARTSHS